jgi:Spy/CpxP family protein refolding chaperone
MCPRRFVVPAERACLGEKESFMRHPFWARRRPHEPHQHQGCETLEASGRREHGCESWLWSLGDHLMRHPFQRHGGDDADVGAFGGRRPLRFLAHKLGLDDKQFTELARILDELKTERAQAAVDDRRTIADYADAFSAESFDATKAQAGATRRAESVGRVGTAIVKCLQRIHAILNAEQREQFAHLVRSGFLMP